MVRFLNLNNKKLKACYLFSTIFALFCFMFLHTFHNWPRHSILKNVVVRRLLDFYDKAFESYLYNISRTYEYPD